jgi:hypothetical protein
MWILGKRDCGVDRERRKEGRKREGSVYTSHLLSSDCYAAAKTVDMTGILDDVSYRRAWAWKN